MLATVEDVKAKMGMDVDDESNDALIASVLAGANAAILERCGYSEKGETQRVEYHENEEDERAYLTQLRPVANLTVDARLSYETDFFNLWVSLDNPNDGLVKIIGSQDYAWLAYSKTHGLMLEPWSWPVVRYTYDVTPIAEVVSADDLAAISDAVSSYAAILATQALARGATMQQIGVIRQELAKVTDIPGWILVPIAKHMRRAGERAEWV